MLDPATYMDAFHRDAAAFAAAARRDLEASVPSCPGWDVATLTTHLTGIYAHRIALVTAHARENNVDSYEDLGLPGEYKDLFDAEFDATGTDERPVVPPGLVDLFTRTADRLETVLRAARPDEPVWTWWDADRTVGFWQRRMAHETAVHRWDVQRVHGVAEPIAPELARDGIDEVLDVMLPMRRVWAENPPHGAGETYHFHCTDGPGEWLVRFAPGGPAITREHARGDVALRGTASDLLLFLWQRLPADRLEVRGDATLVDRFFALAPPD